jgi:hypothetical protein
MYIYMYICWYEKKALEVCIFMLWYVLINVKHVYRLLRIK